MNRRELQNIVLYMIPFGVKNILPLITLPIFTHYISSGDFGLYALCVFFGTICSGLINLGLPSVFERTFFEIDYENRKDLLWTTQLSLLSIFLITAFVTHFFSHSIASVLFNNESLSKFLLLGLIYVTIRSFNFYFLLYFKNDENVKNYTIITLMESILSVSLSMILVVFYAKGIRGFILGQCLGVGITFISIFLYFFFPFINHFDINLLKKQLRLSLPLTPRTFFGVINTQFDRYMLNLMSSLGGVGIYDISQKLANTSFMFLTIISNIFSPNVFKKFFSNSMEERKSVGKYLTPFFYLCTFFPLFVGIFSYEILVILTSESFHKGAPIVSLLSILYAFYFFGKQPQLLYAKKTGLISIITLMSIIMNIGFNIPLIHYYGIYGAAIATTLSGIITNLINIYYSQKYTPIYWERKVYILMLFLIISILMVIALNHYNIAYKSILFVKLTFITIYFGLGIKYNYLSFNKLKVKFKSQ